MNSCSKPAGPSKHSGERRVHQVPDVAYVLGGLCAGHGFPWEPGPARPTSQPGPTSLQSPHPKPDLDPQASTVPRLHQLLRCTLLCTKGQMGSQRQSTHPTPPRLLGLL